MPDAAVSLLDVSKRYRSSEVLRDVTFELPAGRITRVVGRNGSGKSTLLRIVAGVCRPTGGRVVHHATRIGYVPDRAEWTPRMGCRSYLLHVARMRGLDDHAARRRLEELSERLSTVLTSEKKIIELSVGMQQKVLLATAFLVPAELLVLDEPNAGLDSAALESLRSLTTEAAGHAAVLIAAHGDWQLDSDRTLLLRDGQLSDAPPSETVDQPSDHPDLIVVTSIDDHRKTVRVAAAELSGYVKQALDGGARIESIAPDAMIIDNGIIDNGIIDNGIGATATETSAARAEDRP